MLQATDEPRPGLSVGLVTTCSVCGGKAFREGSILWPELIAEWELHSEEVAYCPICRTLTWGQRAAIRRAPAEQRKALARQAYIDTKVTTPVADAVPPDLVRELFKPTVPLPADVQWIFSALATVQRDHGRP